MARHAGEFAALTGPDAEIIEFGAGAGQKVRLLLDAMIRPACLFAGRYFGRLSCGGGWPQLDADYPGCDCEARCGGFHQALRPAAAGAAGARRRIGFFPGSTIGNFTPRRRCAFSAHAAHLLKGGGLLVGVDLVKDPAVLHAAYNDAAGVTAAFNKNLLARANRELGADFDLAQFHHYACYNPLLQRIEMYLVSAATPERPDCRPDGGLRPGRSRAHREFPQIHRRGLSRAGGAAPGFTPRAVWCDPARLFSLHWLDAN